MDCFRILEQSPRAYRVLQKRGTFENFISLCSKDIFLLQLSIKGGRDNVKGPYLSFENQYGEE